MANSAMMAWVNGWLNMAFAMPAADGAMSTVLAATAVDLPGGAYIGPARMFETRGPPEVLLPSEAARDVEVARALWELSERVTGAAFGLEPA
jgi:protochlorophyllide reductase